MSTTPPSVTVLSVACVNPPYTRSTDEILPLVQLWLRDQPERFQEKVLRLFKYSGVQRRYSVLSELEVFAQTSFAQRNQLYAERMLPLAERAIRQALQEARCDLGSVDAIVTTSCTGITIPGLDAYLIDRLRLRQDILRLPVFQMGCAGGVAGLIYGHGLIKGGTCKRVLLLTLESPIATLQVNDYSMANMVSAAIFGDGVAAAVLGDDNPLHVPRPTVVDCGMYHFPNSTHLMGFQLVDSGLQMVLAPAVPAAILEHLEAVIVPFLERNALTPQAIDHYLFHPGGRKILLAVDDWLGRIDKHVRLSHDVLREHGNMSSATVLYILARALEQRAGDSALMLSFGPGFSAQRALLRWEL